MDALGIMSTLYAIKYCHLSVIVCQDANAKNRLQSGIHAQQLILTGASWKDWFLSASSHRLKQMTDADS